MSLGVELWIRWGRKSTRDLFVPAGYWVDHRKRVVQSCGENSMDRNTKGKNAMADDREWYIYIYWFGCSQVWVMDV